MFSFDSGLTSLRANQQALQVISNNIANANTPGYHRQQVRLADLRPYDSNGLQIGMGVDITAIQRSRSGLVEQGLTQNLSQQSGISAQLETARQIEALFASGDAAVDGRLRQFFDQLQALAANPQGTVPRRAVIQAGASLAAEINTLSSQLGRLKTGLSQQINTAVDTVNGLTQKIAQVNAEITQAVARGREPNDLRDQRDQLVNELAGQMDISSWEWAGQPDMFVLGGGQIPLGTEPVTFEVQQDSADHIQVAQQGSDAGLPVSSGRLAGLLEMRNTILPQLEQRLATLTTALVSSVDTVHATGLPAGGPQALFRGTRGLSDVSAPLGSAGAALPIVAGAFYVSVSNTATGVRTLHRITVDPQSDSLQDVATQLSALDHVQAYVDSQSGQLTLAAEPGFGIDFAGRLETSPDAALITGTARPLLSGSYTGAANADWTFTAIGTGTVGVTPGMQLEVRDAGGQLVATLDVGQGYSAGTPLTVADGVQVSFSPGTLAAGDAFSTSVVADPDTTGFLAAVGFQTFFSGTRPETLRVNPQLLADPSRLAASGSEFAGDNRQVQRLLALRDAPLLGSGTLTLEEFHAETIALVGSTVQDLGTTADSLNALGDQLKSERDSISGVDPSEEMVNLLQFQRSFQAAARFLSTVDRALDDLFQVVR